MKYICKIILLNIYTTIICNVSNEITDNDLYEIADGSSPYICRSNILYKIYKLLLNNNIIDVYKNIIKFKHLVYFIKNNLEYIKVNELKLSNHLIYRKVFFNYMNQDKIDYIKNNSHNYYILKIKFFDNIFEEDTQYNPYYNNNIFIYKNDYISYYI